MLLGSLLAGREDEFAGDMYSLSQRPIFDVVAFEDFIDKIRSCVAEVTNHFLILLCYNFVNVYDVVHVCTGWSKKTGPLYIFPNI